MDAPLLLLLLLLLFLNGLFVAAEFALVKVRSATFAESQHKKDKLLAKQLTGIDRYLAACQLGITMASIGIGFLGEPVLAKLFEPLLGSFLGHGAAVTIAFILSYLLVTSLHITIGEQVPKIWAIALPEKVARIVAYPLEWFSVLFRPAVVALSWISSRILWLVGIKGISTEEVVSGPELRSLISSAENLDEGPMLSGIFHMHEQTVQEVMTPMPSVVSVRFEGSVREALRAAADSGHSRLLVKNDEGRVEGIVLVSVLIDKSLRRGEDGGIDELVQEPLYVPEGKPLDDLFYNLQSSRVSMAVVLDEYGSPVGVCTAEDIVEEAVGEIRDENDKQEPVQSLADGSFKVRGETPLGDLREYGIELETEHDVNSVGGLVFFSLGRLPREGDRVTVANYRLVVESIEESRISSLLIKKIS